MRNRKNKLIFKLEAFVICTLMLVTAFSVIDVESITSANPISQNEDELTLENHIIIRESFNEPALKISSIRDEQFTSISMPYTFSLGSEPGSPVYPIYPLTILIPYGKEIETIDVTPGKITEVDASKQQIDLINNPIKPYQKSIPIGSPEPENIAFNEHVYATDEYIPSSYFSSLDVQSCRGYQILSLNLYPTKYNPKIGEIQYLEDMIIDITLKETSSPNIMLRDNELDEIWVKSLVNNPEETASYNIEKLGENFDYPGGLCDSSDSYDYVIITREFLTDYSGTYTWTDFINRKQSEGLETIIVSVEDIESCSDYWNSNSLFNDTAALIREFLRDAYQDWGLIYVLIAGDHEGTASIPRRLMSSGAEANVEADLYWSNLDNTFNDDEDTSWGEEGDTGFDLYSELFIGSLPCDEGLDLSNWMTKSFYYADSNEKEYLDNAAFYGGDTGWSCEGDDFIDFTLYGTDHYYGPYQNSEWPPWGFMQGFDTWNASNPGYEYNTSVMWTAEPPNPGWQGGTESSAIEGLKNAISNDQCTIINGIAHADASMSLDVYSSSWEADYHNTKPFFIHDYGCHCGDLSAADDGILHSMLFHSDTELAFAGIYNTGYGWGNFDESNSSSAWQQKLFWEYCFNLSISESPDNWQLAKAHAYGKDTLAVAIDWEDTFRENIQCSTLFGDPAQRIKIPYVPDHDIIVMNLIIPPVVAHGDPQTVSATVRNIGNNTETGIIVDSRLMILLLIQQRLHHLIEWNPQLLTTLGIRMLELILSLLNHNQYLMNMIY
jgi:hypothetical protein